MSRQQLNSAQQEAITYINGPLLLVAGAGTGKTTVITQKIAHIITQGLAKESEIVALTFTDKAASEMAERVESLLHSSYTDVTIATFHTFCQQLLDTYGVHIGLPRRQKLLTETETWMLMAEHLERFQLHYYRPIGNPYKYIHTLLDHFSTCKDELITPEAYIAYAEEQKANADSTTMDEYTSMLELAQAYHTYNQLLLEQGAYDFGDLIFYTIQLLEQRPHIRNQIQKQYKYILVDEFQDVNVAQYVLVTLLAGEHNQLTVVGDDDQSIYAFRGASVANILRFTEDFIQTKSIVLQENYRSTQQILDTAYASICHNNPNRLEVKLQIDKRLIAKGIQEGDDNHSSVTHIHGYTLDDEVRFVVKEIETILLQKPETSLSDICILVRANNHAEPFLKGLERAGIPYQYLASNGLYREPIVIDALNFFALLDNYHEYHAVYRMLRMPMYAIDEHDIQALLRYAKRKSISLYDMLPKAKEARVSHETATICAALWKHLEHAISHTHKKKPSLLLYLFLEDTGYLAYLTAQEQQGNQQVISSIFQLKQFFDTIRRYEEMVSDPTPRHVGEYYTQLRQAGDDGKKYQPPETINAVQIMTVHTSKGLEFPYVFIVNLVEDRFPARKRGGGLDIPIELCRQAPPSDDMHYQEERRLFYVAMTRAKKHLYLLSADDYGGARNKKISRFLAELGYGASGKTEVIVQNGVSFAHPPQEQSIESGAKKLPIPTSFSFSQLKTYEKCPYQYKLNHVLHLPTKGSGVFSFGSTIHNTLQTFYEQVQERNSAKQVSLFDIGQKESLPKEGIIVPTLKELLAIYEAAFISDWYSSVKQRESFYKKGKEILTLFYTSQEGQWTIPRVLEGSFKIMIGGYPLSGRIDRIDQLSDGSLEIIDYKTGQGKETLTAEDKEQLIIYQIAAQTLPEYRHLGPVSKLTFSYIHDNIQTSFIGKDKEIEKLKEKLTNIIESITKGDFTPTPSQHICDHCDFRSICEYRSS